MVNNPFTRGVDMRAPGGKKKRLAEFFFFFYT
jgi:hypothetical protein